MFYLQQKEHLHENCHIEGRCDDCVRYAQHQIWLYQAFDFSLETLALVMAESLLTEITSDPPACKWLSTANKRLGLSPDRQISSS